MELCIDSAHFKSSRSSFLISLDATSPLLMKSVRKKITKNNGYWPEALHTEEGISKSIEFDNLLISFTGQSKITGAKVYHQQLYTKENLEIGSEFNSVLVQNIDQSIMVRLKDINSTRKQIEIK